MPIHVSRPRTELGDPSTPSIARKALRPVARLIATLLVAVGLISAGAAVTTAASATSYPFADVQVGASARTAPYLSNTYIGTVLQDPGSSSNTQRSWVKCYKDGDWATGNYSTNRWFQVYVYESRDGYANPQWVYVHASFVYNQPAVPACS
jgi:hypothetical protein